jgi:hypothetical protein
VIETPHIETKNKFNQHAAYSKTSISFTVDFRGVLYNMRIENTNKINRLLQDYYPGKLYFSRRLKQNG